MLTRASASISSPWIQGVTASSASSKTAAQKRSCNSRSGSTARLQNLIRLVRLSNEYLERGNVGIPLDERRDAAKAFQRKCVQIPYRVADVSIVSVDAELAAADTVDRMTRKMDLLHDRSRHAVHI